MAKTALLFQPVLQFFDNTGDELAGGSLTFTTAGTATPKDTYADSAKAVTNPNPITLDSAGRPDNSGSGIQIWLDGSYKIVLKNSSGTTIRTEDNVTALAEASGYTAKTTDYTVLSTDFGKLINVSASGAARTITLIAAATAGSGFPIRIAKSDSSANTVTIDGNASETINGATTLVLSKQYDAVKLISDGANWVITEQKYGNLSEDSSGNVTISSGNLTLTSGNLVLTIGNATLTDGDLTLSSGDLVVTNQDSRTATVDYPLTITSTTSGTPAAGIGTGILIKAESGDENPSEFGALEFCATDVTAASEDTYLDILTRVAGAALTKVYRFIATGAFKSIFTHANTADRTYTLPDTDISGWLVQRVSTSSSAATSTTTVIPADDTVPQITEGAEYLTLAITPKKSTNTLEIQFVCFISNTAASYNTVALFQDATAGALNGTIVKVSAAGYTYPVTLLHIMTAGTTSATTFRVRFGPDSSTAMIGGQGTTGLLSSVRIATLTIKEYSA